MNRFKYNLTLSLAALLMAGIVTACGASSATQTEAAGHTEEDGHSEEEAGHGDEHGAEEGEPEEGPHGGRLLEEGAFALEVTIFETGVEPEYRVYPTLEGKPVDPSTV